MAPGSRFRGALPALVPLVLLAGWLYLYTHSHVVDTSAQNQTLALLKDLKQLDSDWSVDVLRSHADINPNYDALVEPLGRFADGLAQVRTRASLVQQPALNDAVEELERAVETKAALIDAFKAENSLFKNSLRYTPTAHQGIRALLRGDSRAPCGGADGTTLDGRLDLLVSQALRYASLADATIEASLRTDIDDLRAATGCYPTPIREPVSNLLSHLDTLLRASSRQGELLRSISSVPVAPRIDALAAGFTARFNAELDDQFGYQRILLAYSAFALLLVTTGTVFIWYRNSTERRRLRALVDEKTRELTELAARDELTRVHNRRHTGELLEHLKAQHARSELPMCIALLDIDLFKAINDRHGHATGDAVLVRFASLAGQSLRTMDLLGRWGGEEFLVAFPQTSLEQAELALNRMRDALAAAPFADLGVDLRITFSGGLVALGPDEPISAAVERADQAMYRAKSGGRNRIEKD
jgi:diguanylate cyclase (GGDEF)-like protein